MSDKHRRKSLSIFRPRTNVPTNPSLPTSPAEVPGPASPTAAEPANPKSRPKTLQKASRTSVFGSLRSVHSLEEGEELSRTGSKSSSLHEDDGESLIKGKDGYGNTVLQYGEVQSVGTMFRKRNHFLVLTESHLIRFKSQSNAVEMFPSIPLGHTRNSAFRSSITSIGSFHENQSAGTVDVITGITLDQVVATYKLDDGKPYFSIEVSQLDEQARRAYVMPIQLGDPEDAEIWLTAIRTAAKKAKSGRVDPNNSGTLEYVARALERDGDYDPEHFQVFKVVQRAAHRSAGRSSAEDLSKLSSSVCYMAIGLNKIHLIPLPHVSSRSSSSSLADFESPVSFGIITLASVVLQAGEDIIQLVFRAPFKNSFAIQLASDEADEIALQIHYASDFLRPAWVQPPFTFDVPQDVDDQMLPPVWPKEDNDSFDRTLYAHCSAYGVDVTQIYYSVDDTCEDAPCFRLHSRDRQPYQALELLAVFRALRYNESFTTISFDHIDLIPLRKLYDPFGPDPDCLTNRSGVVLNLPDDEETSTLSQEVRALAVKSKRLRRLDFSYSFLSLANPESDRQTCGVLEALVPICKRSMTNVDWITLTGNSLQDADLDYLVDAAAERRCHLRALEIGECGVSTHDVDVMLQALATQEGTLEVIDISGVQGRFSPELFQATIAAFPLLRRLNMTRVQKTAGPQPLIAPETLLAWRLQSLHLSQTPMNTQTIDSLAEYLASPKSETLRELFISQCGLTGHDLARLFRSMTRDPRRARDMHVNASANRVRDGCSEFFAAIGENCGPTSLIIRMMDFEKEYHFRELVEALIRNIHLVRLDISKASLPYDAGEETCEKLKTLFAENETLEELDISGEHAHLESARFGIGLNHALQGLKKNKSLKVLKIEHQNLGLQGANTLAAVMEDNSTLREIYCERNDINLQSFTVLVNALQKNRTVTYLPSMEQDRQQSLDRIRQEIEANSPREEAKSPPRSGVFKRSLTGVLPGKAHRNSHKEAHHTSPSPGRAGQDVAFAMSTLEERWSRQVARLRKYLNRNYAIACGAPWDEDEADERPTTAESGAATLEMPDSERTPTRERSKAPDAPPLEEKTSDKVPEKKPSDPPMGPAFSLSED